jgi:energy-coupling factor transporter ATP-binding protein EcfA2
MKIILHDDIIKEIKEVSRQLSIEYLISIKKDEKKHQQIRNKTKFNIRKLHGQLENFITGNLVIKYNKEKTENLSKEDIEEGLEIKKRICAKYFDNNPNTEIEKISPRTLEYACLLYKDDENNGASEDLCNLLCCFAFNNRNLERTLGFLDLKISKNELVEQSKQKIKELKIRNAEKTLMELGGIIEIKTIPDSVKSNTITDEKIEKVKKEYFKYIEIVCGDIEFNGINKRVAIEDAFVPVDLVSFKDRMIHGKSTIKILSNINLSTISQVSEYIGAKKLEKSIFKSLSKKKHLVITGDPGSGKSTLLKGIAIACTRPTGGKQIFDFLKNDGVFPIYIRCRELEGKATSPILEIINSIPTRAGITHYSNQFNSLIIESLNNSNLLLLIDGLDEIAESKNRLLFVIQLKIFLDTHKDVRVIITSREVGLRDANGSFIFDDSFSCYAIAPLFGDKVQNIALNWFNAVLNNTRKAKIEFNKFIDTIEDNMDLELLVTNPLSLVTLLLLNNRKGYLPTDKTTLYTETIRMLLELWNVEGHGHVELDYDETKIQLAYVAYYMTKNGQEIINHNDLKDCLTNARKYIDRKLDYTVNDFIKRVENRSGLLRMTGDFGYEFIHLSYQEYLSAFAIIKRLLPNEDIELSSLDILISHIAENIWAEVILATVMLSEIDRKAFCEYLISDVKGISEKEKEIFREFETFYVEDRNKKLSSVEIDSNSLRKLHSHALIGLFLINEVEMGKLLDEAMEVFAKYYFKCLPNISHIFLCIFDSKHRERFLNNINTCLFNKYDDAFIHDLYRLFNLTVFNTYFIDLDPEDSQIIDKFFNKVKKEIRDGRKEVKCKGLLILTFDHLYLGPFFASMRGKNSNDETKILNKIVRNLEDILDELTMTTSFDDPHYYYFIARVIGDLKYNIGNKIQFDIQNKYIKIFLNGWISHTQPNLQIVTSWVLEKFLERNIEFNFITEFPNIKEIVSDKYEKPQNGYDRSVAINIGKLIGLKLNNGKVLKKKTE